MQPANRLAHRRLERNVLAVLAAEEWQEYLEAEAQRRQDDLDAFIQYMEDDRREKEFYAVYDDLYEDDPAYADDWADRHADLYFDER